MPIERGVVPPGGRTGQRRGRAQLGHVGQGGPSEADKGVELQPGRARHPLHLAHQGHEVIRGDARRGVVRGAMLVVDHHHRASEHPGQLGPDGVARHGEGDPAAQPDPSDLGRGQGHERVERGAPGMGRQDVQTERPRQVHHHGPGLRRHPGGHLGDGGIGGGDHEDVDARCGVGHVAAPAHHVPDVTARVGERRSQ